MKACNGQWLKGKGKDFVHELIRGSSDRVAFQVIKDFEQVTFKADANGGFRKVCETWVPLCVRACACACACACSSQTFAFTLMTSTRIKASSFRSNPLLEMMGSVGFDDLNEGGKVVDADGDDDDDVATESTDVNDCITIVE